MNSKKIFLISYARKNLGDDIFVKMLLENYSNVEFFTIIKDYEYLKELDKYKNLNVIIGDDIDETAQGLDNINIEDYDGYVYIGGSIFMEGNTTLCPKFNDFIKECKKQNRPFYYISCNYGPYKTEKFLELSKEAFSLATDICFRDKHSYNLFKDLNTVRYAPDYAFSYKLNEKTKIKNSIGISVINIRRKNNLKEKQDEYIKCLIKNIKKYISNGNKVYLYSFCKYEEDEVTIDEILKAFSDNENVLAVRYDGNIDKFLEMYSKMEYMICGRFHATILSCVFNQKIFITSYSDKTNNVIKDLELELPIINFSEINDNTNIEKEEFLSADIDKMNNIIKNAKKQDEMFRNFVKKD